MSTARKQRLLEKTKDLVGAKHLALGLGISDSTLADWIEGRTEMPDRYLMPLASLLVKAALPPGGANATTRRGPV
jgi:hypothetical protein